MDYTEEYRLSRYKDYGPLQEKEHVRLVRNEQTGVIFIKKVVDKEQKIIYEFLKKNPDSHWPKIEECIEAGQYLIIIEEYIKGKNLYALIEEKCLNEYQCSGIICELCKALQLLHGAKPSVICRDLKAENILVTPEGQVKIVDFNIARMYQPGKKQDTILMGTAGYAAPEQFGYFQTDNRTDIYALGVLLNYMLTGKFPHEKVTGGRLRKVVEKCTALNPLERYQSVEELVEKVSEIVGIEGGFLYQRQEPLKNKLKRYIIPGFRSGEIWKMFIAVMGYMLVAEISIEMEFETEGVMDPVPLLYIERAMLFIVNMIEIFIVCNYMGIREKLPIVNSMKKEIRIAGYFLYEVVLLMSIAFFSIFVQNFI